MDKKERSLQKELRKISLDQMMKDEGFDQNESKEQRGARIKHRSEMI